MRCDAKNAMGECVIVQVEKLNGIGIEEQKCDGETTLN